MKEIKINVDMKVKNMYEFLMRHAYFSKVGVASLAFSVLSFVYLCINVSKVSRGQLVLLVIASLMFTVINPIWIYVTAAKQVKLSPTFKETITYEFGENGVRVVQGDEELPVAWEEVKKVVETRNNLIIYLSKVRAFVIPREELGDHREDLVALIENVVDGKACSFKKA